jgi:hypothetical protein
MTWKYNGVAEIEWYQSSQAIRIEIANARELKERLVHCSTINSPRSLILTSALPLNIQLAYVSNIPRVSGFPSLIRLLSFMAGHRRDVWIYPREGLGWELVQVSSHEGLFGFRLLAWITSFPWYESNFLGNR